MIQAVLAPTPGMVCSRSKFCCSDGVDFMHSRIARLNVIISACSLVSIKTDSDILNETRFTLITRLGRQLPAGANKFLRLLETHLVEIAGEN